jgi:hypothetical protein
MSLSYTLNCDLVLNHEAGEKHLNSRENKDISEGKMLEGSEVSPPEREIH